MKSMNRYAIGVDIGGRSAKLALVRDDGTIAHRERCPLDASMDMPVVAGALAAGVAAIQAAAKRLNVEPVGVGVVMPGYLDETKEHVEFVANLPKLSGTSFPRVLTDRVTLPVRFDVDGNAAALGEYHFGAGRGARRLLVAVLGTGIGGGVVLDGKLLRVRNHVAGSIGHVLVDPDGPRCGCGARGCLEMYASARGFERFAAEAADHEPAGLLARLRRERGTLSGPELAEAIAAGDATARQVVDGCARWLAVGAATWCAIYMPDRILFGGGVAAIGEPLLAAIRAHFSDLAQPYSARSTTIELAALGNDAGVIGAACLWLNSP